MTNQINPAATMTAEIQQNLSPADALQRLKDGNKRFVSKNLAQRDLNKQVSETTGGQHPFAVVLSCIDSRVPVEVVFDQGIGDIFSARVAGNIVNEDMLGSMEFACKLAGSKVVLVLGHTRCGAVHGALSQAKLGNLTALLSKIEPAMEGVELGGEIAKDGKEMKLVTEANVRNAIKTIRSESSVLADLEKEGKIIIQGAIYRVEDGSVQFLD